MSSAWASDFSYKYFKKILESLKSNFEMHLFSNAPELVNTTGRSKLLLRHDVDADLNYALKMAEIENVHGICSTYMVMVSSPLYNIEDPLSQSILKRFMSMGHEVGLHFDYSDDESNNNQSDDFLKQNISSACQRIEDIIRSPVRSISYHIPMPQFLRGPLMIDGRVNAYAKELMDCYLSDSAGRWREGEPLPQLLESNSHLIQLLIHPIWWGDEHRPAVDRLQAFFEVSTEGYSPERIEEFDVILYNQLRVRRSGIPKTKGETVGH